MSKTRNLIPILILSALALSCILGIVFSCRILADSPTGFRMHEDIVSSGRGSYTIDPRMILMKIADGDPDAFILQTATPEVKPVLFLPVHWEQKDFYTIFLSLQGSRFNESFETWNIRLINFGLDCAQVNLGPQYSSLQLLKIVPDQTGDTRIERNFFLKPQQGLIEWSETDYHPNIFEEYSFSYADILIPAEMALQIAEGNGGAAFRQRVNDACRISLAIVGRSEKIDWRVDYETDENGLALEMVIDKKTGEYTVTYPTSK